MINGINFSRKKIDKLYDPIYNNKRVSKLINNVMKKGFKIKAQKIVYYALEKLYSFLLKKENQKFLNKKTNLLIENLNNNNFEIENSREDNYKKEIFYSFSDVNLNDKLLLNYKQINIINSFFQNDLNKIINNYSLKTIKYGGASYKCPFISNINWKVSYMLKRIIKNSRKIVKTKGIKMFEALYIELCNIVKNVGDTYNQFIETENIVKKNFAYNIYFKKIAKNRMKFFSQNKMYQTLINKYGY